MVTRDIVKWEGLGWFWRDRAAKQWAGPYATEAEAHNMMVMAIVCGDESPADLQEMAEAEGWDR